MRCRKERRLLAIVFEGKGLPPDDDVQRLLSQEWLDRNPKLARSALPAELVCANLSCVRHVGF